MGDAKLRSNNRFVALVTGATGFVGSHVARKLVKEGWQVHILSRADSRLPNAPEFAEMINHIHDGTTENMITSVAKVKPDVVFHLASLFLSQHESKDIESLIHSNVLFGNQLLEAMRINAVTRLINTGTSWQHYNDEDYNPVCLYAATKQAFEAILEYYIQACDVKAITLKLFDTYGSDDLRPKLIHLLHKAATSGKPLNMSPGDQLIDMVHIDDVVLAYMCAAQRLLEGRVLQREYYAVSSGNPLPLKELVQRYSEILGKILPVNWGASPYRFREVMNPWTRGEWIENWAPRVTLADGLEKVINKFPLQN